MSHARWKTLRERKLDESLSEPDDVAEVRREIQLSMAASGPAEVSGAAEVTGGDGHVSAPCRGAGEWRGTALARPTRYQLLYTFGSSVPMYGRSRYRSA